MPFFVASSFRRVRSSIGIRIEIGSDWVILLLLEYRAALNAAVIRSGFASQKAASSASDLNSGRSITMVLGTAGRRFLFGILSPRFLIHWKRGYNAISATTHRVD